MEKITVKDIARDLGLSVGTVYRSLNNTGRVSEKTKRKVLDYAEKMGFQPNVAAQGLAKRKKFRIVCAFSCDYPEWCDSVRAGVERALLELSEFRANVTFLSYLSSPQHLENAVKSESIGLLEKIENNEADGIILVPSINHEIVSSLELAKQKGIPVICINADAPLESQRLCYYGPDEEKAGRIAGELIAKLIGGQGNIALIGVESVDFYRLSLRKKGFFSQLCMFYPGVNVIYQNALPINNFREYLSDYLDRHKTELSGIYVYDPLVLAETADVVKELGLSDLVLIGHECLSGCQELIDEGWIDATLCQEVFAQGFYPMKLLYNYLLSNIRPNSCYYSNVNIVFRSNLDLLRKNEDGCGY